MELKKYEEFPAPILVAVVERIPYGTRGKTYPLVECRCNCGKLFTTNGYNLKRGKVKSCGCMQKQNPNRKTHGLSQSPEYGVWSHILSRCTNPNVPEFKYYGERGITVCAAWKDSFEVFYADMGKRPSSRHSIERLDNSLGYSPANCVWATHEVQMNNQRRNLRIAFRGTTQTLSQWCKHLSLPYHTVRWRLKAGWDVERAFTTPVKGQC